MTALEFADALDRRVLEAHQARHASVLPPLAASVPEKSAEPVAEKPAPVTAPVADTDTDTFLDILMRNDAVRQRSGDAFARREKADAARLRLAAVADALSSLGNLVGTTKGAFNQEQKYQVPVVYEDMENSRAYARKYADKLNDDAESVNLLRAKLDATKGQYATQLALEQAKTDRAMALAMERAKLAEQQAGWKTQQLGVQHGYKSEEETQKQEGRKEIQTMKNEQSDINNRRSTGTSAANNIRTNDRIRETGGSGGVGAYTTTETERVVRDDYGNIISREKVKSRTSNGQTSTTTSSSPGGTHGSAAAGGNGGSNGKKAAPYQKKEEKKVKKKVL